MSQSPQVDATTSKVTIAVIFLQKGHDVLYAKGEGKIVAPDRNNPNDVIHPNRERISQNIGQLHRNKCILICLTLINPSLMLTGGKHFSLEAKSVQQG